MSHLEDSSEMNQLITRALRKILHEEDFPSFLAWMRREMGVSPQLSLVPDQREDPGPMATWLALTLWNATPLPSNNFRPRPVSVPGRNQKCICGSGKKFKKCCSIGEHVHPPIDANMIWPLLFESMPKQMLNKALRDGSLPLPARILYCDECLEGDRPDQILHFLKDYYFGERLNETDEIAAYGLNLLFDALDSLDMFEQKIELIEHISTNAPPSPLRSEAMQRLASIMADAGNLPAAFAALKKAQQDTPHNPALGALEVQLLLLRGDFILARQRARFLAGCLRRQDMEGDYHFSGPILDFLEKVVEDPEAMASSLSGPPTPDDSELEQFLEKHRNRKPVACDFEEIKNFTGDEDFSPACDRSCFKVVTPPELNRVEIQWRKVMPIDPLFGIELYPGSEQGNNPWLDEDYDAWRNFLFKHPEALDSITIIDDLLTLTTMHPDWPLPEYVNRIYTPLLARGVRLVMASLKRLDRRGCLPWLMPENRPFLRILVRDTVNAYATGDMPDSRDHSSLLLELNPWDNHGFRLEIVNRYLRDNDTQAAMEIVEQYPDDITADILYGRALALYRMNRMEEAEAAAREAKSRLPRVASYLVAPKRNKPNEYSPYGIISGGKEEAWLYRREMRSAWKATRGALTWLKKIR